MSTRKDILQAVSQELQELFELEEQDIVGEARLEEDLDLDSIDAIDLIVRLQEITKKKVSPDQFRSVRTVDDIVDRLLETVPTP